ncbi:MAG: YihY/virulence factor BrkB family protein, partial [Alistipes sp.]|nr:YihY/virulence factor BrkB family protein [Alistipes sp.]
MQHNKLYTFFTETLIERPDSEWEHWYSRLGAKIYKVGYWLIHGLFRHGTMVRSAAMTYYTLTSIVPILAVAFALVKGFGLSEVLVASLYDLFPQNPEIIEYLLSFAENALARTQGGVVAAVALVMLFWSIIQLFSSIESAFNNIWEVKTTRSIARQWSDYLAVIL